jgi:hypothetical protein
MADKKVPPSTGQHDLQAYYLDLGDGTHGLVIVDRNYVWNTVSGEWEKMTQPGGGGGEGVDPVGLKNVAQDAINPATEDTLATLLTEAVFTGRVGEVQASPTANTVLDRLKVLATLLNGGLPAALTAGGGLKTGLVDALPAGANNIGDVDVVSSALPTGAATSAKQDTEIAALQLIDDLRNALATVATDKLRVSEVDPLPAGTNNIGDVDVLTLPSLPAGANNIGDVDVLTLPSLPAGSNNIGGVDVLTLPQPTSPTTPTSGVKTVTTADTRVQLDNVACKAVSIKAHAANTGIIYLGNVAVAAANGFRLAAGESVDIAIDNVNRLYIDASVNGEGVSYLAVN